jgi:hypothetical protein
LEHRIHRDGAVVLRGSAEVAGTEMSIELGRGFFSTSARGVLYRGLVPSCHLFLTDKSRLLTAERTS